MSYTYRLPVVSPTAGPLSDGALRGSLLESQLHAALNNVLMAPNKYVMSMDHDQAAFHDRSSALNASQTVSIWGNTSGAPAAGGILTGQFYRDSTSAAD